MRKGKGKSKKRAKDEVKRQGGKGGKGCLGPTQGYFTVATYLRCSGIFSYDLTANPLLNRPVKEFWKSVKIWWSYCHEFGGLLFLEHSVLIYKFRYEAAFCDICITVGAHYPILPSIHVGELTFSTYILNCIVRRHSQTHMHTNVCMHTIKSSATSSQIRERLQRLTVWIC